jgi:LPXTG-motif cell wall-anchored protein
MPTVSWVILIVGIVVIVGALVIRKNKKKEGGKPTS